MKQAATAQKHSPGRQTHGITVLKRAINTIGNRLIDRRTVTGRALAQWRTDLIRDLGGDISTQQGALIDLAVKSKLLLDSIDSWLLVQPSLINHCKRALLPVVKERQQLADGLAKYLGMLGLERKVKQQTLETMSPRTTAVVMAIAKRISHESIRPKQGRGTLSRRGRA